MEAYTKLTLKLAPQKFFIVELTTYHQVKIQTTIARNIMNLSKNIRTDTTKVAILGIISRSYTFNHKVKQINEILKKVFEDGIIPFILHHGINTRFHLNSYGLHLNVKGTNHLA